LVAFKLAWALAVALTAAMGAPCRAQEPGAAPADPAAPPAGGPKDPATYLTPDYACQADDYVVPYASFNGTHVLHSQGAGIVGRDQKTSLLRWQWNELSKTRSLTDLGKRILFLGEHVQMVEKSKGKREWDFPLNCFDPSQCNADVLGATEDRLLVGGFGNVYNMVMLLNLADGSQVWPNWLTTCPIRKAALQDGSLVVACASGPNVVQTFDLQSRVTKQTIPSPAPELVADGLWVSARHTYVTGLLGKARKLYVFSSDDGSLVRTFSVKDPAAGEQMGFLVAPQAARFVPWQSKGGNLLAWGMDAQTGKAAWQHKWASGALVGQHGELLVVTSADAERSAVTGIDLASGQKRFHHPVPFAQPFARIVGDLLFVSEVGGARFVVFLLPDGVIRHLGRLPEGAVIEAERFYFSLGEGIPVLLAGKTVTVYSASPLADYSRKLGELLDQGEEDEARGILETLSPFRLTLREAQLAFEEMLRFKWLKVEEEIRQKDFAAASARARECLATAGAGGLDRWFGNVGRLLTECALSPAGGGEKELFLMEMLQALRVNAEMQAGAKGAPAPELRAKVDLAVVVARGLWLSPKGADAFAEIRRLHENGVLAPILEAHPYWSLFQVEEVETTLRTAEEAYSTGETGLSAELLHDLAKLPVAGELFGRTWDPWLDAQGIYLLPPELQGEKLKDVLKALRQKLGTEKKKLLAESVLAVCQRACGVAETYCPGRCIEAEACNAAGEKCRLGCARGEPVFAPPEFSAAMGSAEFNQCR
jgi:hypothetical protein